MARRHPLSPSLALSLLALVGPSACGGDPLLESATDEAADESASTADAESETDGDETGSGGDTNTDTGTGSTESDSTGTEAGPTDTQTGTDPELCGDGIVTESEACDDGNADESDGCLSDCTVPQTCAEILAKAPASASGAYELHPDGNPLLAYCDMVTDGGGWTLVAKVHHADEDDISEPTSWFAMVLEAETLGTPDFTLNQGLASHGAGRFEATLGPDSLARFELFAADDLDQRAVWFKAVASPAGFATWFADDLEPSMVCTDVDMTQDCELGTIASEEGMVELGNMRLNHYGLTTPACDGVHMRLDGDPVAAYASGMCSCTLNEDDNAWSDSYLQQWGNAMHVWLR